MNVVSCSEEDSQGQDGCEGLGQQPGDDGLVVACREQFVYVYLPVPLLQLGCDV
jgi:hypothetical protein